MPTYLRSHSIRHPLKDENQNFNRTYILFFLPGYLNIPRVEVAKIWSSAIAASFANIFPQIFESSDGNRIFLRLNTLSKLHIRAGCKKEFSYKRLDPEIQLIN